jgi:RNA polymerase sigma-70 factor (ECF subfamily)
MGAATWAELLFAASGLPVRMFDSEDRPALSSQLDEMWRAARATWPSVELGEPAFISHLALHLSEHVPAADALQQLCTADLYLACACATGNADAIAAFERHCLTDLDRALARLRVGPDVIAEVKQRVRCRVLLADRGRPRIVDFSGRGTLRAWVRVIAVREALRVTRWSQREIHTDDDELLQGFVTSEALGLEHLKDQYRRAFTQAFDRALRELPVRDKTMLRQHVLDGLTIDRLGALYRLHRATAARTLERARRAVLAATRAHMRAELEVGSTELSSILRSIRSRLEISLRGLRRRPHGGGSERDPGDAR